MFVVGTETNGEYAIYGPFETLGDAHAFNDQFAGQVDGSLVLDVRDPSSHNGKGWVVGFYSDDYHILGPFETQQEASQAMSGAPSGARVLRLEGASG